MSNKRALIFDFDGTLADTAPLIVSVYNEMARQKSWRSMEPEDYRRLRMGNFGDARRWAGIHVWQVPFIVRSARRLLKLESEKVELFEGIPKLLRQLQKDGHDLYVLSRNKPEIIHHVFNRFNISHEIMVLKNISFFGSKHRVVKRLIKSAGYDPRSVWVIGDETRDIESARRAGVKSIAVSWGLQDEVLLKRYKPTAIAHMPKDIVRIIKAE